VLYLCSRGSRVLIVSVSVVLRLRLIVDSPYFFGSVVTHEGDFYSFVESSVVYLPLIGLAGLLVACREETLHLFLIRHLPR
jgi:hypothetical protein